MAQPSKDLLPDFYDKQFFKNALESGLRASELDILSFELENHSMGGENYCSNIYRAFVKYKINDHIEDIALIVKSLPNEKQGVLRNLNIYAKETVFYLDIMPKLKTLMWHTKTPWQLGAKHILSITQPEQTIVLEDLSQHGFSLRSRQIGLDQEDAVLVLEKLAQYHALTMVMALKDPKTVKHKFQHGLLNAASIKAPAFKALFGAQLLKLAALAAEWPGFKDISSKLHKYHENFTEMIMKSVYPLEGAINVLNHGDIWVNNLLFGRNLTQQQQVEVRLIDFQLCFYGSPGFDINYFFNTSVQLEVLQNSRDALVTSYFQALVKTLASLPYNIAPPTLERIQSEIGAREGYGFFVAFGFLPLMTMQSVDSQDNSLENLHNRDFAAKKIELMFHSNARTLDMLKYVLLRTNELGIFDQK